MLYDVIFVLLVLYAFSTPLFVFKAIRFGMSVWDDPAEMNEQTVFHLPKRKKKPKMTAEEERTMQILKNIDRYDGTSNGQVEIK